MATVCEICGDVGYGHLLLSCDDCKCAMHQYCLAKVLFDGSLLECWFCNECLPKYGEVTYEGSLQKAPKHARSGSAVRQASTTTVESTREARPCRNHKNKSEKSKSKSRRKKYSSSKNSLLRKHKQKGSDMGPMGNKTITSDCNAPNISGASGKALHSCEVMIVETSKANKDENQQVDHEHSVRTLNNDCVANRLPARVKEINLQKPLDEFKPPLGDAGQLNPPKDSNCLSSGNDEIENPKGSRVTPVLAGENQNVPSILQDRVDSSSFSVTNLKEIVLLDASNTSVELSYTVENCVKDNPRKRRQLILLDDDEEEAADVQSEGFNHLSLECDGSLIKHRIGTEDCVEQAVQTGDLNGQNLNAVQLDILIPESSEITQPVKKRRYIEANEDNKDEEVLIGSGNAKCDLNDVSKLASETLVATDHILRSRMAFDSEATNQQCSMYSQPVDEPIWSGILKINNVAFVSLAAHLSTKACGLVWELSRSLQPVVEVIKLPQLEAWPQSWKTSGPTDGDIALYFFPPSASPNEQSDGLVEEIIDNSDVLKVVIGVAELLIFPSTILPEQYHLCQGKRYLWGVFKRREDESNKDALVEEQDGSACDKEGEIQEHHFMDRRYEEQCESLDHETSVVKHPVNVENQLLAEHNREAQEAARNATMGLLSPSNNSSSAEPNPPKARSNCFTQPRADSKLDVPEEVDHQEAADSAGPAAATPMSIDSAEGGVVPPMSQSFGFVVAWTPRTQQLIQEMVSEGALLFSVAEGIVTAGSTVGNNTGAQVHLTPDSECPPMQERCQSIGFVPLDDNVASEACLELFPARQEHIGWTPRVETSMEVDLDLSLSARWRASSVSLL